MQLIVSIEIVVSPGRHPGGPLAPLDGFYSIRSREFYALVVDRWDNSHGVDHGCLDDGVINCGAVDYYKFYYFVIPCTNTCNLIVLIDIVISPANPVRGLGTV